MAYSSRRKNRKQPSGSRTAALVVLLLIVGAVAGYFFLSPHKKTGIVHHIKPELSRVKPFKPISSIQPHQAPVVPLPTLKKQSDHPPAVKVPEIEKLESVGGTPGRLAIIIDDMGSSMSEARSLAAIKVPLTFSIIPGLRVDRDVAAYAANNKIETMIHIPMQPKGWPARHMEANGLLVSMDSKELQERVSGFVQEFPGAVGANNHMGSEFTEQEEKMVAVLQVMAKNDLFFIDSLTSPKSICLRVAQQLGLRSAKRNVFLDNEQERSYILGQLNQAVRLARKNGSAIAICHPHPVTIATLAEALPKLARQGLHLVQASQLVK